MGDSPLPNLHFLESISLPETPGYSTDVSLIRDPNYSDILFAKTEQSVYRIGFAEIMTALEKRTPVTGVHCTVDWLVNAAASSRFASPSSLFSSLAATGWTKSPQLISW